MYNINVKRSRSDGSVFKQERTSDTLRNLKLISWSSWCGFLEQKKITTYSSNHVSKIDFEVMATKWNPVSQKRLLVRHLHGTRSNQYASLFLPIESKCYIILGVTLCCRRDVATRNVAIARASHVRAWQNWDMISSLCHQTRNNELIPCPKDVYCNSAAFKDPIVSSPWLVLTNKQGTN